MSISWLHGSDQQVNAHTGIIQMQGILSATHQINIPSMLSQLVLPAQAQACICRERLDALRAELAKQKNQANQHSAAQLEGIATDAARMEAAARQEGEARCATVQVTVLFTQCMRH